MGSLVPHTPSVFVSFWMDDWTLAHEVGQRAEDLSIPRKRDVKWGDFKPVTNLMTGCGLGYVDDAPKFTPAEIERMRRSPYTTVP